jgi:predicted DNA-binding transcriptional regulator YafY
MPEQRTEDNNGRALSLARALPASRSPISRLLQLIVLLQAGRCPNARRLGELCEVSTRTIYRDLALLADAGFTVLYRPDRQGYQIARGQFLQPPRLEEREVLALLVLCRHWDQAEDLGLRCAATQAVDKLLQSLPDPLRMRLMDAAELIGEPSGLASMESATDRLHREILAALVERKQLRLWIRERMESELFLTKMAVYRLSRVGDTWCLVGRSSWHCSVTLVAIDQIVQVEPTSDLYEIPPRFRLDRFLARLGSKQNDSEAGRSG